MIQRHSKHLSLVCAVALALFGTASMAVAQQTPPPPPPPPPQQPAPPTPPTPPAPAAPAPATTAATANPSGEQQTGQFYQGTESSAQYPLPDSNGGTLTVNAGMPAQVQNYGPPPSFSSLDTNHNGCISESEAQSYPPLDSDFLFASHQGKCVSQAQYKKWVSTQGSSP